MPRYAALFRKLMRFLMIASTINLVLVAHLAPYNLLALMWSVVAFLLLLFYHCIQFFYDEYRTDCELRELDRLSQQGNHGKYNEKRREILKRMN